MSQEPRKEATPGNALHREETGPTTTEDAIFCWLPDGRAGDSPGYNVIEPNVVTRRGLSEQRPHSGPPLPEHPGGRGEPDLRSGQDQRVASGGSGEHDIYVR